MSTKKSRVKQKKNIKQKVSDKNLRVGKKGYKPPTSTNIGEEIQERSTKVTEYTDYCIDLSSDPGLSSVADYRRCRSS